MRTTRPTIQRLTGGLAALALGVTLTACGSSDNSESAQDPAGSSTTATSGTTDEPSESTSSSAAADIDEGGEIAPDQFAQMIKDGIAKTTTAHIVFSSGAGGAGGFSGDGDVDYSATPPNMQMTMKVSGQELHMVMVDSVMYIESPQAAGKFMKYDLTDPSNPLGSQFVDQLDPAKSMAQFADALSSVQSLGKEDVDGESLAHYLMTIDTTKLSTATQSANMPPELKADVWLDDESRMAKSSIDLGQGATYDTTLSNFGDPVDIAAPPASQVIEVPKG
ncbi:MAG: LppX_LprAFG lipoprotein [Nocardioides sp.]